MQAALAAREDKKPLEERGFLDKALAPHSEFASGAQQRLKELAP